MPAVIAGISAIWTQAKRSLPIVGPQLRPLETWPPAVLQGGRQGSLQACQWGGDPEALCVADHTPASLRGIRHSFLPRAGLSGVETRAAGTASTAWLPGDSAQVVSPSVGVVL